MRKPLLFLLTLIDYRNRVILIDLMSFSGMNIVVVVQVNHRDILRSSHLITFRGLTNLCCVVLVIQVVVLVIQVVVQRCLKRKVLRR